jgi:hypothetical protein
VGRARELERLTHALAGEPPCAVVYLHGPAGVGKSTLLREFAEVASDEGIPTLFVDGREMQASPDDFLNVLRAAAEVPPDREVLPFLCESEARRVLQIDNYESLEAIDSWIRDSFVPELPECILVLIAGRKPPAAGWRTDSAWNELLLTISLHNLENSESVTYLSNRSVPPEQHSAVLEFTGGHPLALSLVADVFAQKEITSFEPSAERDVIRTLLDRFIEGVPSSAHASALEVASLARVTTEALLADTISAASAEELFSWLRSLSFMESSPLGIHPHEMAREAMTLELRWRNPERYGRIHTLVRNYYATRLTRVSDDAQQALLFDYIYLHRNNAVVKQFFEFDVVAHGYVDALRESDVPAILATVRSFEGEESARLAAMWMAAQPRNTLVIRTSTAGDAASAPIGFLIKVSLEEVSPQQEEDDPAVRACSGYLRKHAPLGAADRATIFRFWMGAATYQDVSPVQSMLFVQIIRHYFTTQNLAFSFLPCAQAEFWLPVFTYAELNRLPDADFTVGGRSFGTFGHDWRKLPPQEWLQVLSEKEVPFAPGGDAPPPQSERPLNESQFAAAVQEALKSCLSPARLQNSPLLEARVVLDRVEQSASRDAKVQALRQAVLDAATMLAATPKDRKLFRALRASYLEPVGSQEVAAEKVDVAIATYRRHLKEGAERVIEILWRKETGG